MYSKNAVTHCFKVNQEELGILDSAFAKKLDRNMESTKDPNAAAVVITLNGCVSLHLLALDNSSQA